ncbi:MAG: hypothetical protein P8Y69_00540 [Gammaproteobacteria bacterium]|jgi:hypothetical protein
MLRLVILLTSLAATGTAYAGEADPGETKTLSGMSVLGNNEAPKSLVIVPWKSSQIGDGIGLVESLSNRPLPVDRDVFGRELHYYELRTHGDNRTADDGGSFEVGSR